MKVFSSNPGKPRVLVASAGGMGNIGDDIVSGVAAAIFKGHSLKPEVKYATIPYNREEIAWADVVVIGGGGVFYDWSVDNVNNYLNFLEHARYMGKKTVALGVGTQGITTAYGKRRYREVLSLVDLITVRDEQDAVVLSDTVGVVKPVHVAHDLAFLLPHYAPEMILAADDNAKEQLVTLQKLRASGRPVVGIGLAAYVWEQQNVPAAIQSDLPQRSSIYQRCIEHIRQLAGKYEVALILHSRDDKEFCKQIIEDGADHITTFDVTENRDNAVIMLDFYRNLDLAIVSRYHAFILALLAHTPVAILGTQQKTVKSIKSSLPSLAKKYLFSDEQLDELFDKAQNAEYFALEQEQIDDVNSSIIKANANIEFVESFLYPYKKST